MEDYHGESKKTTSRPVNIQEITTDAWTLSDEKDDEGKEKRRSETVNEVISQK